MNFTKFAQLVHERFNELSKHDLYVVDLSKDALWDTYINAFPKGTNEIYKERTQHDCNCCKNFIRDLGNIVTIVDDQVLTIWDTVTDANDFYTTVAEAMAELVRTAPIRSPYLRSKNYGTKVGAKSTTQLLDSNETITWDHFYATVPQKFISNNKASVLSSIMSTVAVFERGLEEITPNALLTLKELIDQSSLYRGEEFKEVVNGFIELQSAYNEASNKHHFIWLNYKHGSSRIRNTVIGSLLQDLSEDIDIDRAVTAFELKVAPSNYKRPKTLITQGMIDQAMKTVAELGIEDSLHRRLAVLEDISVNNVIFVDRTAAPAMKDSIADMLSSSVKTTTKSFDKAETIHIDKFIKDVVPNVDSIEIMVDNKHTGNLMSLVAPEHADSPNILQWDNNFSWAYNGNVTDSMKERVKSAGGRVDGDLRFSIQWNENRNDKHNDLDAHCVTPVSHIFYSSSSCYRTKGMLDVDIQRPGSKTAVENITWQSRTTMVDGVYKFAVNNYSGCNTDGFRAEIEFDGQVYEFDYSTSVTSDVLVAEVTLKDGQFTVNCKLEPSTASKEVWGVSTQQFHKVTTICHSPNHWDDNEKGNKHTFFILDGCSNPEDTRSLYNEFLDTGLTKHRKVFEVLGSKLKCPPSEHSLAGLGFSSTKRDELLVKVSGKFTRQLKIQF